MAGASETDSAPATGQTSKAKVFVSYSRKDTAFADRLESALKIRGFEVFIDRHDISALEKWWKRIETLIVKADTVVFVLSPDSVASEFALKEVDFAASLNKRFAPIVYRRVDDKSVPAALAELNHIFFDDETRFEGSADRLVEALRTDIAWIRQHTEFGEAARQWSAANRPNGLLLRSPLLEEAERWIGARPEGVPAPTEETQTFIQQSRASSTRRRNTLTASLTFGLMLALGLAGYAYYQRNQVQLELDRANQVLAESIDNDLGIEIDEPLTTRQRNALWKLADADEAVKRDFVLIVAGSANEMVRASVGLPKLLRAIGPLSPDEVTQLLQAAIDGLPTSTDPKSLQALAATLQALAPKLSDAQASEALDPVLRQMSQTADPNALLALAQAVQALPVKPTDLGARQALEPVLKQIGQTTDPHALLALAQALQALPAKLTDAQTTQALDPVLKQIGQTTDPDALQALAQAVRAQAAKLTEAQATQALDLVLKQVGQTTSPFALLAFAQAIQALPAKLTDVHASEALDPVLKQVDETTNPLEVPVHVQALQALAAKLTETQASHALVAVLNQIGQMDNSLSLAALAQALPALPVKLTETQASKALDLVLKQIAQPTDGSALLSLAQALSALAPKLTETQASQALDTVLKRIEMGRFGPLVLRVFAQALQALPAKLSNAQASQALDAVLKQLSEATAPDSLGELARALGALPAKPTEAQVSRALDPVLKQISDTAAPTLNPVLKQIGQTTGVFSISPLAQALQALAPKLTETQTQHALPAVVSSFAWAATDDETTEWARALVALSVRLSDQEATNTLVAAVAYPVAAGSATEILLDAVHARHSYAPAKEAGTEAGLKWLATKYPEVLGPPVCPSPPQPTTISGLKCPSQTIELPPFYERLLLVGRARIATAIATIQGFLHP
jgi:hypothetical protein